MDDEFLNMTSYLNTKKNIIRWDQNINFINLHLKGVYDYMIGHTEELLKSHKVKTLSTLAYNTGGDVFNILYHEEIFSLVEHLITTYNRPKVSIRLENISNQTKTYMIDQSELISQHYNLIPTNTVKNNPFLFEKNSMIKLLKYPIKC